MKFIFITILTSILFSTPYSRAQNLEKATFAGGCFWCMEHPFEKLEGVTTVISGFSGGTKPNPSYPDVAGGHTKHLEVVQVTFDPKKVSYQKLVSVFWMNIDPTDDGGQFVDRGAQYATAIFYHNDEQRITAEKSKKELIAKDSYNDPVITPIREFSSFYPAEDYHQDYYKKTTVTALKYKYYRSRSGRDEFINNHWTKNGIAINKEKKSFMDKVNSFFENLF